MCTKLAILIGYRSNPRYFSKVNFAENVSFNIRKYAVNNGYICRKNKLRQWQNTFTNTTTGQILAGAK